MYRPVRISRRSLQRFVIIALPWALIASSVTDAVADEVLIEDAFERTDPGTAMENLGGGWTTNSRSRAGGNRQVWFKDGAMYIERHAQADHGVSVVHEAAFDDVRISLRFKISKGDRLGLNLADMKEKSVHAGHICMAIIRPDRVELRDLKTGNMDYQRRQRRQAGKATAEDKRIVKAKTKTFKTTTSTDQWHTAELVLRGDTMTIAIDGNTIGSFASEGIDHPTKSRLRIAVEKTAWVDDLKLERLSPKD